MLNSQWERLDQALADRLAKLRTARTSGTEREPPLSQADLAKLLGITRSAVANIENHRQRVPAWYLYAVCEVLSEDVHDVLPSVDEVAVARRRLVAEGERRAIEIAGKQVVLEKDLLDQIEGAVAGDGLEDLDA